jgi:hypothetical protein
MRVVRSDRTIWRNGNLAKWETGEVGKWKNGKMAKWETGKNGKWRNGKMAKREMVRWEMAIFNGEVEINHSRGIKISSNKKN